MDQIAALHWLQENVAEFGGDPTSVTLMGHGTGAACATFLMTSPAVPDGKSISHSFLWRTGPAYSSEYHSFPHLYSADGSDKSRLFSSAGTVKSAIKRLANLTNEVAGIGRVHCLGKGHFHRAVS